MSDQYTESEGAVGDVRARKSIVTDLADSFLQHKTFLACVVGYIVVLWCVALYVGVSPVFDFSMYCVIPLGSLLFLIPYLVIRYLRLVIFRRPPNLTGAISADFMHLVRTRLFHALPVLLGLPLFLSAYTGFKYLIPVLNPYSWDPTFAGLDAWLHGGVHPWIVLQSMFSSQSATVFLDRVYYAWFIVLYSVLYWQAFSRRNPKLRMQFFLTFILGWIVLGTVMAIVFCSVGPCYYQRFFGDDLYHELLRFLNEADQADPILALTVQRVLLSVFDSKELVIGCGVSAMPSMHVVEAVLFALVGWRSHWFLGSLLTVFSLLIMIGSVHLAWHYAIDGYAAVLLTIPIWWVAGRWAARLPFPKGEKLKKAPVA